MKGVALKGIMFGALMLLFTSMVGMECASGKPLDPPGKADPPGRPFDPPGPPPWHPKPKPVPEPMTLALVGAGIAGVGAYLYAERKKNRK